MNRALAVCRFGCLAILGMVAFGMVASLWPTLARADAVLDPRTYTSPSGEYALFVDPGARDGSGTGVHRLSRNGQVVWEKVLDFTLWDAVVTDQGRLAGYAYQAGYNGWRGPDENNTLRVVAIDEKGEIRLDDKRQRQHSGVLSTPPPPHVPLIDGMCYDAQSDRLVLRTATGFNENNMIWWVYRAGEGVKVGDLTPEQPADPEHGFHKCIAARIVPQTGLMLVHWYRTDFAGDEKRDATLSLIDPQGNQVWTLDIPGEYGGLGPQWNWWDLHQGNVVQIDARDAGFDFRSYKEKSRISFTVRRDERSASGWTVTEAARVADSLPTAAPADETSLDALLQVAIELLGEIQLGGGSGPPPVVTGIVDFSIDNQGRIGFLRRRDNSNDVHFVLVKPDGQAITEIPIEWKNQAFPTCGPTGDGRWVMLRGSHDDNIPTTASWIDVERGVLTPIADFTCGRPERVIPCSNGGFFVFAHIEVPYSLQEDIVCFDAQGKRLWNVRTPGYGQGAMFQDAAPLPDGGVAVLTAVHNTIEYFDNAGEHKRSVVLSEALGRAANYPSGLSFDADGGLILHDFNGEPPVWRISAEGKATASLTPAFADGATFRLYGDVQRAPDGRLWTSDRNALLRLDDEGRVDLVLGPKPQDDRLDAVDDLTVANGRIFALNARTHAVHVFDHAGKPLRVLRPNAEDVPGSADVGPIAVAGDGWVYLGVADHGGFSSSMQYIMFDGEGKRARSERLGLDSIREQWVFRPGTQERWVLGYHGVFLVDANGEVAAKIDRRPDDRWFDRVDEGAVAPDGSLAVVSSANDGMLSTGPRHLSVYSPTGAGRRTVALPDGILFPRIAFNGSHVVLCSGDLVVLIDAETGDMKRLAIPPRPDGEAFWTPVFSPDGREIWLRQASSQTLQQYRLPD